MDEKLFTPDRANAALTLVRPIAVDLAASHARLAGLAAEYQRTKRGVSPSQIALNELKQQMSLAVAQRDACAAELAEIGVDLKDPATGLLDFPAELDGERVLLCWRLGEDRVDHYHTAAEGFAGRRLIPVPVTV